MLKVSSVTDCMVVGRFLTSFNLLNARSTEVLETGKQHKMEYKTDSMEIFEILHCRRYVLAQFSLTHTKIWGCLDTLDKIGI